MGAVMAAASATMTFGALATPRIVARLGSCAPPSPPRRCRSRFLLLALTTSLPLAIAVYCAQRAHESLAAPVRNLMMEVTPSSGARP